jgi:Tol biopolymer transport system component/C-terminal processing protease CtpA/Prc
MLLKALSLGQRGRLVSLGFIAALTLGAVLAVQNTSTAEPLGPDNAPLWMRYPAISPDGKTIAFSFEGHLFVVPSAGGLAQPLTAGTAVDTSPVWSPDGKSIAFASDRYGNFDVFLISPEGGPARRLTTHSADETPVDFTPDGQFVVFNAQKMVSAQSSKFPAPRRFPELYKVSIEGGKEPEMILVTPALNAQFDKSGQHIIYDDQKGYEDLWRKHQTSAFAHDVWIYDIRTGDHTKLTNYPGEDRNPVWAPDENSIFYLSEQSGSFNVWHLPLNHGQPGTPQQITKFEKNPVRFLTTSNNGDLCFGFDGEIYLLPAGTTQPMKVAIRIAIADNTAEARTFPLADGATEMVVSPNGKEIAFVVRGDIYVAGIEHGDTKRITNNPVQARNLSFSPDGRKLAFAAEYNNAWSLYEAAIVQPKEKEPYFFLSTVLDIHPILENGQENFRPKYSPDGKEVAYLENRTTLKVLNLESKQTRLILPGKDNYSYEDGDQWFDWSPDGKWFVADINQPERWSTEVALVDAGGQQQSTYLTKSGFASDHPVWTQEGKTMAWVTDKFGLHGDGSGGGSQLDIFEMFFTQEAFDRFKLSPAEYEAAKAQEEEEKKKKDSDKSKGAKEQASPSPQTSASAQASASTQASPSAQPNSQASATAQGSASPQSKEEPKNVEPIKIDLANIEDRTERLTLGSSRLADFLLTKDGEQLLYIAKADKGFDLWLLKPRTKDLKRLAEFEAPEVESFGPRFPINLALDKEEKNVFVLANGHISKVEIASSKMEPVRFSAEKELNRAAERAGLFEHMWRLEKEKFYVTDMGGVDWDYYKKVYAKFLPYITNNRDFAEMMSEMLGELNASHTGCRYFAQGGDQTAALGAFFDPAYQGAGLKILEIIEKGPLVTASEVQAGMIIEKIDGVTITPGMDTSPLLNFKAGKATLLSIFDPAKSARFDVTIKPVNQMQQINLLYERWVKRRRELVNRLSNGILGYVHVRGMNDESYRDTYSNALGREQTKKGLVVDTRYNGGGNLHDQLATFLSGKPYLQFFPRGQSLGWEPTEKWYRKTALIANEGDYSDGMLFPWTYKHFNIGKFIGMPVPGTGTAVWWEFQQDPTLLFGMPEVGFLDEQGHYMEKTQVEPDIEVMNDPKSVAEGRDLQIERAVAELMNEK